MQHNLKQLGLALHNYHTSLGVFPAGTIIDYTNTANCGADCRGTSFYISILPYFEQAGVERYYDYEEWNGWLGQAASNMQVLNNTPIKMYLCPSVTRWNFHRPRRDYFGVVGGKTLRAHGWRGDIFEDGLMYMNSWQRVADIRDGASNTFAIGESVHASKWGAGPNYGDGCQGGPATWWFGGATLINNPDGLSVGLVLRSTKHSINSNILCLADDEDNDVPFGSDHPGGSQFVFADGHVKFISDTIDFDAYQALSTRAGAEVVGGDEY